MKFLALSVILALAVTLSSAVSIDQALHQEWHVFKSTHGKSYSLSEEQHRMQIFSKNREEIANHNARFVKGEVTYSMGLNQFSDLTADEYEQLLNFSVEPVKEEPIFVAPVGFKAPASIDWRAYGAVTPVKDQQSCGSCWAFASTGALEGHYFLKTGQLVSLSEQNLIDCSKRNHGCSGGNRDLAFEYIKSNGGIDTEYGYPYENRDGPCRYSVANRGATLSGYVSVRSGSETDLMNAVGSTGPVSVGINASGSGFQQYSSGVYRDSGCSKSINHGVLVVGYGTDPYGGAYWLVKNSWGTSWGEAGYIKMARNNGNQCAIATRGYYPRV